MSRWHRFRRRWQRRPDLTVWGDARALPFTEGEAVVSAGQIGPAHSDIEPPSLVR